MSITFYVSGWNEGKNSIEKVFLTDLYPNLDEEDFARDPYYDKDENGRHFQMETVYENAFPELNVGNSNARILFNALGLEYFPCSEFPAAQISEIINSCLKLINNEKQLESNYREDISFRNIIQIGLNSTQIKCKLKSLMELLIFAKKRQKSVYWG